MKTCPGLDPLYNPFLVLLTEEIVFLTSLCWWKHAHIATLARLSEHYSFITCNLAFSDKMVDFSWCYTSHPFSLRTDNTLPIHSLSSKIKSDLRFLLSPMKLAWMPLPFQLTLFRFLFSLHNETSLGLYVISCYAHSDLWALKLPYICLIPSTCTADDLHFL